MIGFDYFKPKSLKEVWLLKKQFPDSRYIAGGTDLLVKIKNCEVEPKALVSLRAVPELSGISIGEISRIGAMTTITDLINHRGLKKLFPVLIQAAKMIGSPQIRNVGTVGGNLCNCSPCADTAVALLVLDAKVVLENSQGTREIFLKDFFVGPGKSCRAKDEILTEILLPKPADNSRAVFMKKRRVMMDLAIASLAVRLDMKGKSCQQAVMAAGSVAAVPLRLERVEKLFKNTLITGEIIDKAKEKAMSDISPITDVRSTDIYRREIIGIYLKRAVNKLLGWDEL